MKLKIRHKLFLTIFLTSSVVASGLFFFLQWNFDRGFLNYVNNQEMTELKKLEEQLIHYYSEKNEWSVFQGNHQLWINIHQNVFTPGPRMLSPAGDRPPFRKHDSPHMDSRMFGQRVILFDKEQQLVIGGRGPDSLKADIVKVPITYKSQTIGYLAITPATELSKSGDLQFVEQQTEAFAIITLVMVVVSILLSFPLTNNLLKPIKHLTEGTRKLIRGQFTTRIPVTTGDELGHLSEHFNILALTLEDNEQTRQRWIADISHELRTPLSVLRGELEALQDGVRKTDSKALDSLYGEILHLQRLVNDLYELSMSDIGALTYKKIPVNPLGILKGTIELFEQRFADKNLELQFELPGTLSYSLLGDPDRLQQLFSNLLENSLRYTDKPGLLEISAKNDTQQIIITFQDSAPGVEQKQLSLLFDRFFRTDPSRHRAGNGAGLGLAICTNIAEAHQGTITAANSSTHGGLSITITLPLTA